MVTKEGPVMPMVRSLIFAAAGLLFLGSAVFVPQAIAAVTPCSGSPDHYFTGEQTSYQSAIFGARANFGVSQPGLCGQTSASSLWAMTSAASAIHGGAFGWAQAGYGQFGSQSGLPSGYRVFSQYTRWCTKLSCATTPVLYPVTKVGGQPPATGSPKASAFEKTDHNIHMYYNGTQLDLTDTFNVDSDWQSAWDAEFLAETFHEGTDVPGYSTDRVSVTNLEKALDTSSDWGSVFTVTSRDDFCRYKYDPSAGSGTDFDIWTYPPYATC
jgi:hypothetical protein